MKKLNIVFLLFFFSVFFADGQNIKTTVLKFKITDIEKNIMPPLLNINIDFLDENNVHKEDALSATKSAKIKVTISNEGGSANNLVVDIQPKNGKTINGLTFGETTFTNISLKNGEKKDFIVPVTTDSKLLRDSIEMVIDVMDPKYGYAESAVLKFHTLQLLKGRVIVQGVRLIEKGVGLKASILDEKLQKQELAIARLTVQNVGDDELKNLKYLIESNDNFVQIWDPYITRTKEGVLTNLKVGESADIDVKVFVANAYKGSSEFLPISITFFEPFVDNPIAHSIKLPLDKTIEPIKVYAVNNVPDNNKSQSVVSIFTQSTRITSNLKNIHSIPNTDPIYKNAIAIVLGVQKNKYINPPAPYAANDAELMGKYFKYALGIEDVRVYTDSEVPSSKLYDLFERNGELANQLYALKDSIDVFIYYSGHGIPYPEKSPTDVYLFPFDGKNDESITSRGYSINRLYNNLAQLPAKSVTVMLDACFSGSSSRASAEIESVPIGGHKALIEVSEINYENKPWDDPKKQFRVITSSSGTQTTIANDQSKSGLFTYFLALGMQGEADSDSNGEVTMSELYNYININLPKEALRIKNHKQNPQFFGHGDMVVVKLK